MGRTKSRTKKKGVSGACGGGSSRRGHNRVATKLVARESTVNPFDAVSRKGASSNFPSKKQPTKKAMMGQESRQRVVGEELRRMHRNNQFSDRRVGQMDNRFSGEEKAGMRFALQRKKMLEQRSRTFNLPDADEDDVIKTDESSEDEDEGEGELASGWRSVAVEEAWRSRPAEQKNKRREALSNMIAHSKKEKADRHVAREHQMQATDKLDDAFSRLSGVGALRYSATKSSTRPDTATGEYDSLYAALKFDKTTRPTAVHPPLQTDVDAGGSGKSSAAQSSEPAHSGKDFASLFARYKEQSGRVDSQKAIDNLEKLASSIHRAMQSDVPSAARVLLAALNEYRSQVCGGAEVPTVRFLAIHAFVELVTRLFPANEPLHPVITPTLAMAAELITSYRIRCLKDCARMMLLCALVLRMIKESGRYLPELTAFLKGALMLCVGSSGTDSSDRFPTMSFPISEPNCHMLLVVAEDDVSRLDGVMEAKGWSPIISFSLHSGDDADGNEAGLRVFTVRALISTLQRYLQLYSLQSPAFAHSLYGPFRDLLAKLPLALYPAPLVQAVEQLRSHIERKISGSKLTQMQLQQQGVNAVKSKPLLEPRFDECFDPLRPADRAGSSDKRLQRVRRNLRKETRGAMRKLRADSALLAREQAVRDSRVRQERNQKTKRILGSLQSQESEYKKRTFTHKKRKF